MVSRLPFSERIESPRLLLQRLRYEDAEEIFYVYASKSEATTYVSWPTHQTMDDTRRFLNFAVAGWRAGTDYTFSIRKKENNRLIGTFGIRNDNGIIQIGYVLGPLHWDQGYATEACQTIVALLKQMPEVLRVWTFVDAENIASSRVLVKAGLEEESRPERWFTFVNQQSLSKDCIVYKLRR